MAVLAIGLILFMGVHMIPVFAATRAAIANRLGEDRYKLLFTAGSAVGLVLVIWGKATADFVPIYEPPAWGRHVTMLFVLLAFICLAAFHLKGRIRKTLRHPFLTGIILWGCGHLLANGDLASILLFGGFVVYSVIDIVAVNARKAAAEFTVVAMHDFIAAGAGIVLYGLVLYFHGWLFGVPVLT